MELSPYVSGNKVSFDALNLLSGHEHALHAVLACFKLLY